jgi:hypothetical protein
MCFREIAWYRRPFYFMAAPGGILLFHDCDALPSIKLAVDGFSKPKELVASPLNDRFGGVALFKPPAAERNWRKVFSVLRSRV